MALIVESEVAPRRRMLAGVARYVREHDPWAIYLKGLGVEKSLSNWLNDWEGDGIIAALGESDGDFAKRFKLPLVDVVGLPQNAHVPLVHAHDEAIGRLGAEHLLERGFTCFGFVEFSGFYWSAKRRAAFHDVIRRAGFPCLVHEVPIGQAHGGPAFWEEQQAKLVNWLRSLPKPIGVMATTDRAGQRLLEACMRADLKVPEQVAVVGADNDEVICSISYPPLSSVIINDEQRGYEAAALLDVMMSGGKPPRTPVLIEPAGIVCRASSDILAIDDEPLAAALRFVREHACDGGITVEEVVRAVPLSRSVLERRFRDVLGRSVNDEMIRVRLNRAVELLSSTPLELKQVAQRAGFCTPSYMGVVFRQRLGRTPGSYRTAVRTPSGDLAHNAVQRRG